MRMARARSTNAKTTKELVQQQRGELYSSGHQNLNMALSAETIAQIDVLKERYGLRSRDAVVGRIIRHCMTTIEPEAFTLRAAGPDTVFRRISPIVPGELAEYVRRVQLRFRNLAYGPVFEMMLDQSDGNLGPSLALMQRPAERFPARKHDAPAARPASAARNRPASAATGPQQDESGRIGPAQRLAMAGTK